MIVLTNQQQATASQQLHATPGSSGEEFDEDDAFADEEEELEVVEDDIDDRLSLEAARIKTKTPPSNRNPIALSTSSPSTASSSPKSPPQQIVQQFNKQQQSSTRPASVSRTPILTKPNQPPPSLADYQTQRVRFVEAGGSSQQSTSILPTPITAPMSAVLPNKPHLYQTPSSQQSQHHQSKSSENILDDVATTRGIKNSATIERMFDQR